MKKIIINSIIISLLSISAIFADNNNNSNNTNQSTNTEKAVVTITDMNGKTVDVENFNLNNQNESNIKLNPSSKLSKGTYVVTLTINNQKMTQKLIVK